MDTKETSKSPKLKPPKPQPSLAEGDRQVIDEALGRTDRQAPQGAKIIPFPQQRKPDQRDRQKGRDAESA